jgi:hypothetical protein
MQAQGEIVPLPDTAREVPRDFRTFFEDEHRQLFKMLHHLDLSQPQSLPVSGQVGDQRGASRQSRPSPDDRGRGMRNPRPQCPAERGRPGTTATSTPHALPRPCQAISSVPSRP